MINIYDSLWLRLAEKIAARSTCLRNKVGAVIIKDNLVVGAGFNMSPENQQKCNKIGYCYRNKNKIESGTQLEKCRASGSHAETNAICDAAKKGFAVRNATLYLIGHNVICVMCRAMLINAKISRVVMKNMQNEKLEFFPKKDWKKHLLDKVK